MAKLIGTDPNQVPTNADLGTIAYQDSKNTVLENAYIHAKGADGLEMGEDYSSPNNSSRLFFNSNTATGNWAIFNNSGDLIFKSSASAGSTSGNYTALSLSTSNVSIGGNLVLGNGNGIDFSATSNGSGTTSSELLDDYEEGTWTPVFISAGTPSYTTQFGRYNKIGRVVYCTVAIYATGVSSGSTIGLAGHPYSSADTADTSQRSTIRIANSGHLNGLSEPTGRFRINGSTMEGVKSDSQTSYMTASQMTTSGTIQFSTDFCYYTS